jgi:hypothetical protein
MSWLPMNGWASCTPFVIFESLGKFRQLRSGVSPKLRDHAVPTQLCNCFEVLLNRIARVGSDLITGENHCVRLIHGAVHRRLLLLVAARH